MRLITATAAALKHLLRTTTSAADCCSGGLLPEVEPPEPSHSARHAGPSAQGMVGKVYARPHAWHVPDCTARGGAWRRELLSRSRPACAQRPTDIHDLFGSDTKFLQHLFRFAAARNLADGQTMNDD